MTDIQFQDNNPLYRPRTAEVQKSRFAQFVVSTGIVSTEQQANYVLIGLSILAIALSIYLITPSGPADNTNYKIGDEFLVPNSATR